MTELVPATTVLPRERTSVERLYWAFWMIGAGGLLLGLQWEVDGGLSGTGFASLGVGALVALAAAAFAFFNRRPGSGPHVPRDGLTLASAIFGSFGVTFVTAGVLVPGGPWMLFEALLLVLFFSRTGRHAEDPFAARGPSVGVGALLVLALMLAFKLWVVHEGVKYRWAAVTLDVPGFSAVPWLVPPRARTVSLFEFSVEDFGMPRDGLAFAATTSIWALGFALCAGGLWLRQRLAFEYENDRIQATIETLPPDLALLVQRVLPEQEWSRLGLHGQPPRLRMKRIAALTEVRVQHQLDLHRLALDAAARTGGDAGEFAREIALPISRYRDVSQGLPPREVEEEQR